MTFRGAKKIQKFMREVLMKLRSIVFVVVSFLGLSAFANVPDTTGKKIVADIQSLALKCVVQTYTVQSGKKVYASLKNTCSQIEVLDQQSAHVTVDNQTFKVVLVESADADEGDLDHVLVYDLSGKLVGQKLNVLAFDDILLGLAGGHSQSFAEAELGSN
jgi:hypothetical protein